MASFKIKLFPLEQANKWDNFVDSSNNGTLYHKLGFLSYHGDKFNCNTHHLGIYKGSTLYGILPLGIFEENGLRIAKSPFGATYGGPVFLNNQNYSDSRCIVHELIKYFTDYNVHSLSLTLPIAPCYNIYSETFQLVLYENNFTCTNRDISNVVPLQSCKLDELISSKVRNKLKKRSKHNLIIKKNVSLDEFYSVLEKTFQKHQERPTHTLDELIALNTLYPDNVYANIILLNNTVVAGICFFVENNCVNSSFYLMQDYEFQQYNGLTILIVDSLQDSIAHGYKWFNFGCSSYQMQGRENIFKFKEAFGAIGCFRNTYSILLT